MRVQTTLRTRRLWVKSALAAAVLLAVGLNTADAQKLEIEDFSSPITVLSAPGDGGWYQDRYLPGEFVGGLLNGRSVLRHQIHWDDRAAARPGGQQSTFYNTQGRKYNLGQGITVITGELFIPEDWATHHRRADIWGTGYNASGTVVTYPIIGFANTSGSNAVLRYWDELANGGSGDWVNITSGITYDKWYKFTMKLEGDQIAYYIDDAHIATAPAGGTAYFGNLILQGYNFADAALAPAEQDLDEATATYDIYWDSVGGVSGIYNNTAGTWHTSIQDAVNAATAGDSISIANGNYTLASQLLVNKSVVLQGESEAGVTVDVTAVASGAWPVFLKGSDITVRNWTVVPPVKSGSATPGYTFHVGPDFPIPGTVSNIRLENITVGGAHRTPFDIHGADNVTLVNLTASNTVAGNAVQFTGVDGATLDGLHAQDNAWGSVAFYTSGPASANRGSSHITVNGDALDINGAVYAQNESGLQNSDITVTGWNYNVFNSAFRAGAADYTYFAKDITAAAGLGQTLNATPGFVNTVSVLKNITTGNWEVAPGVYLLAAVNKSVAGEKIVVHAGTYTENMTLNKGITLEGPNAGVAGTGTRSAEAVISNSKWTVTGNTNLTIDGFTFASTVTSGGHSAIMAQSTGTFSIVNNIFSRQASSVSGDDGYRGIERSSNGGTMVVNNNKFTSSLSVSNPANNRVWQVGIYCNPTGAGANKITDNVFEKCRTAVNFDGISAADEVDGNTFNNNGTHLTVLGSASVVMPNNEFGSGGTYFNNKYATAPLRIDASGSTFTGHPASENDKISFDGKINNSDNKGYIKWLPGQLIMTSTTAASVGLPALVAYANADDSILINSGVTHTLPTAITISKQLKIRGRSGSAVTLKGDAALGGNFITITAPNTEISNITFTKTDKAGPQNIIGAQVSNVTVNNCKFNGQYVPGDNDVSRAAVQSPGANNFTFTNNTVNGLRQPAYLEASGAITGNTVNNGRGFVVAAGDLLFDNNTFTGNAVDIALLSGVAPALYTDLVGLSAANHNAFIEDQRHTPFISGAAESNVKTTGNDNNNGLPATPYKTIQRGIDRILPGGTVNIYPGNYSETAPGQTIYNGSTHQFGLHVGLTKTDITVRGVDASGSPVTDAAATGVKITTNATNTFGYSGIFVEGNNFTIQGVEIGNNLPSNDKTIEVIADGFAARYVHFNLDPATDANGNGGSLYLNKASETAGPELVTYDISDNRFTNASISISSGTGRTGDNAGRIIANNTMVSSRIDFNGETKSTGGYEWYAIPVGGATITGNSFAGSNASGTYVRRRGAVASAIDFDGIRAANTFGKYVLLQDGGGNNKDYSYTEGSYTFVSNEAIFSNIQAAADVSADGDKIFAGAGTYNEDVVLGKSVTLEGEDAATTILKGLYAGSAHTLQIAKSNTTVRKLTVTRDYGTTEADWYASPKNQGITINQTISGTVIDQVIVTGNRNGIYGQIIPNTTITNSVIEDNRTGIHFGRDITGSVVKNNFIRNNFTHGLLFNADFGAAVVITDVQVNNNSFSGNWYSDINYQNNTGVTVNPADLSGYDGDCNWFGTVFPVTYVGSTTEPGYAGQQPSQFGGTAPGAVPALGNVVGVHAGDVMPAQGLINGTDADLSAAGFQPAGLCIPLPQAPKLVAEDCGRTDFARTDIITATAVTGASGYEFYLYDAADVPLGYASRTVNYVALSSNFSGYTLSYGETVKVRVRAKVNTQWSDTGIACFIGIADLYTKLQSADCGNVSMKKTDSLTAIPLAGATQYEFQFLQADGTPITPTVIRNQNSVRFLISQVPAAVRNAQLGDQFKVTVRALAAGAWTAYGDTCLFGFENPLTKLDAASCGVITLQNTETLTAIPVDDATQYEYLFQTEGGTALGSVVRSTNTIQLAISSVRNLFGGSLDPGTRFLVSVRSYITGVWSAYGDACLVGIANPTTRLVAEDCGRTDFLKTDALHIIPVPDAVSYEYEFLDLSDNVLGSVIRSYNNGAGETLLLGLGSLPVQVKNAAPGDQLRVAVRAYTNVWNAYGDTCLFGFYNPTTSVISGCNTFYPPTQPIEASPVTGATQYEFEFSGGDLGAPVAVLRSGNTVPLQGSIRNTGGALAFLHNGIAYDVRVRARIGGVFTDFGSSCVIIPYSGSFKPAGIGSVEDAADVTIYPNPASSILNVDMTLNGHAQLVILDIYGRTVQQTEVTATGQQTHRLDVSGLAPGNYTVGIITDQNAVYRQFVRK